MGQGPIDLAERAGDRETETDCAYVRLWTCLPYVWADAAARLSCLLQSLVLLYFLLTLVSTSHQANCLLALYLMATWMSVYRYMCM